MKLKRLLAQSLLLAAFPVLTFCGKKDDQDEIIIQDSQSWKTINEDKFTVDVPENWVFKRLPGTDSFVGLLTNKKDSLVFDYGLYSNKLEVDTVKYAVHFETIHGKAAKIIKSKLPGETPFGMHIDSVGAGIIGKVGFTIEQTNTVPMEENKVLRIFRSFRF